MRDRTELQFVLETTTRCGGSCQGCFLSSSERTGGGLWPDETFERVGRFIGGYIDAHLEVDDPKEISINLGQGDHLLAGPERLSNIIRWIHTAGRGRAVGFMTASAIGRTARVMAAVDAVRRTSLEIGQPVIFDLVLDPAKTSLPKFKDTYSANINYIRQAFGGVDLHINVGPDTLAAVTPHGLLSFLAESRIRRFSLNLTPTRRTAELFHAAWGRITDWICEFLERWDPACGVEINVGQVLSAALEGADELRDEGLPALAGIVTNAAGRTVYLNGDGMIYHLQAGVGDIACCDRVGLHSAVPMPADDSMARSAAMKSAGLLAHRAVAFTKTNRACRSCDFATVCPRIGAVAIGMAMEGRMSGGCPSGLYPVLETIRKGVRAGLKSKFAAKTSVTHLPTGFALGFLPNGVPFEEPASYIRLDMLSSARAPEREA